MRLYILIIVACTLSACAQESSARLINFDDRLLEPIILSNDEIELVSSCNKSSCLSLVTNTTKFEILQSLSLTSTNQETLYSIMEKDFVPLALKKLIMARYWSVKGGDWFLRNLASEPKRFGEKVFDIVLRYPSDIIAHDASQSKNLTKSQQLHVLNKIKALWGSCDDYDNIVKNTKYTDVIEKAFELMGNCFGSNLILFTLSDSKDNNRALTLFNNPHTPGVIVNELLDSFMNTTEFQNIYGAIMVDSRVSYEHKSKIRENLLANLKET